ncbi:hypothetical protein GBAR_LOCUS3098, partial [Geodia barretti]
IAVQSQHTPTHTHRTSLVSWWLCREIRQQVRMALRPLPSVILVVTFLFGYANASNCDTDDELVIIFLFTTLPPLLFLFLCGVGSTFASIGWFYYWRSTRPDISSRRTQPQHNPSPGIVEMQQVPHV